MYWMMWIPNRQLTWVQPRFLSYHSLMAKILKEPSIYLRYCKYNKIQNMNFPVHNQILFCTTCDKILKYALFIKDILLAYSQESGEKNGTIDVSMEWRNTYLPASAKVKTEPQVNKYLWFLCMNWLFQFQMLSAKSKDRDLTIQDSNATATATKTINH